MKRTIAELSDRELTNLQRNYELKGLEVGGHFSLAEVKLEQLRRTPSALETVAVARKIIELSKGSADGLITYGDLWQEFHPGKEWRGNADQQVIGKALARVLAYCVGKKLPILTTLVVQKSARGLSPKAIDNIVLEARSLGVDVGPDAKSFVDRQRSRARQMTALPSE